jgi:hypothetical protein
MCPVVCCSLYKTIRGCPTAVGNNIVEIVGLFISCLIFSLETAIIPNALQLSKWEYLGWVGDSRMAATYVHLFGRNVENALFKLNGIKTEDEINDEEPMWSVS